MILLSVFRGRTKCLPSRNIIVREDCQPKMKLHNEIIRKNNCEPFSNSRLNNNNLSYAKKKENKKKFVDLHRSEEIERIALQEFGRIYFRKLKRTKWR